MDEGEAMGGTDRHKNGSQLLVGLRAGRASGYLSLSDTWRVTDGDDGQVP